MQDSIPKIDRAPEPVSRHNKSDSDFPPIPEKHYFSIGEVARLCRVERHVLGHWEQEFLPHLAPDKRRSNRRYYRHQDILMVRKIRTLLYEQSYTVPGVKAHLAGEIDGEKDHNRDPYRQLVAQMIGELEALLADLKKHG